MNNMIKSGNTPLIINKQLSDRFNITNLFIKDESKNPFGTWKDRRSELIITKAQKGGVDKLCLVTAGNAGYSISKFAERTNIKVVCIIDKKLLNSIKEVLKKSCYKVLEVDLEGKILKPEEVIALARENDKEIIWDVTNGFPEAYEPLVIEIKSNEPDYIVCPIATGEAFTGFYNAIKNLGIKTKLMGVMPESNPSFADKLSNSLMSHSTEMQAILRDGNEIVKISEDEIKSAYNYVKDYIDCEPSSAIVFGIFSKFKFNENDKIILINSGRGLT